MKWVNALNVVGKVFKISSKDTRTIKIDNNKHIHLVILLLTTYILLPDGWLNHLSTATMQPNFNGAKF